MGKSHRELPGGGTVEYEIEGTEYQRGVIESAIDSVVNQLRENNATESEDMDGEIYL